MRPEAETARRFLASAIVCAALASSALAQDQSAQSEVKRSARPKRASETTPRLSPWKQRLRRISSHLREAEKYQEDAAAHSQSDRIKLLTKANASLDRAWHLVKDQDQGGDGTLRPGSAYLRYRVLNQLVESRLVLSNAHLKQSSIHGSVLHCRKACELVPHSRPLGRHCREVRARLHVAIREQRAPAFNSLACCTLRGESGPPSTRSELRRRNARSKSTDRPRRDSQPVQPRLR